MADEPAYVFVVTTSDGRYLANPEPRAWTDEVGLAVLFNTAEEADEARQSNRASLTVLKIYHPDRPSTGRMIVP